MFEIKENQRILPDGTRITTYARDIYNCNVRNKSSAGIFDFLEKYDNMYSFIYSKINNNIFLNRGVYIIIYKNHRGDFYE